MSAQVRPELDIERAALRVVRLPECGARVELLEARYLAHRFIPHWREEYVVCLVERGTARVRTQRDVLVVSAGRIVLLEPGAVHAVEPADPDGYACRTIYLPGTVMTSARMAGAGSLPGSLRTFGHVVIDDAAFAERLRLVHASLMSMADEADVERSVLALAGSLQRRFETGPRLHERRAEPRLARMVRDHLEANHARVVTLAELARLTGRNPFYLSRTFRGAYGVPPYAYLALVRVHGARELLAAGRSPSMVAHAAGFSDQSHFNRQFKRVFGVTPGQYSRSVAHAVPKGHSFVRSAAVR
jgi:AraC-like DNA-binding protein